MSVFFTVKKLVPNELGRPREATAFLALPIKGQFTGLAGRPLDRRSVDDVFIDGAWSFGDSGLWVASHFAMTSGGRLVALNRRYVPGGDGLNVAEAGQLAVLVQQRARQMANEDDGAGLIERAAHLGSLLGGGRR